MSEQKPIDQLTPEELREIAVSLRWTPSPDGRWTMDPAGLHGPFYRTEDLPAWDTDANAALTLADALGKDGWTVSMWSTAGASWNVVSVVARKVESPRPQLSRSPSAEHTSPSSVRR